MKQHSYYKFSKFLKSHSTNSRQRNLFDQQINSFIEDILVLIPTFDGC